MKPHIYADIIKAWADGAKIEQRVCRNYENDIWTDWLPFDGTWKEDKVFLSYRIKHELKPDVVKYAIVDGYSGMFCKQNYDRANLKITFDGETGKLKSAEVLK